MDLKSSIMDIAGVREALHREPFEPFLIRLADGRSVEVRHPEFVAVGKRRIVVLADDEVESWSLIEPLLIVSLDALPQKPKGGNGTQRRKRPTP
jgi:hypothetical protein